MRLHIVGVPRAGCMKEEAVRFQAASDRSIGRVLAFRRFRDGIERRVVQNKCRYITIHLDRRALEREIPGGIGSRHDFTRIEVEVGPLDFIGRIDLESEYLGQRGSFWHHRSFG